MHVSWKRHVLECVWGAVRIWFSFSFSSWIPVSLPSSFKPWLSVCKWSEQLPTLDTHFPDGQKVKAHLSLSPRYHGDPCKSGQRGDGQTLGGKRAGDQERGDRERGRGRSLGQGRQMFTMNLHWVCYRWYRPPRIIICLGFPKQRWTGTPVYTGLFCLQLLESLLLVYYLRLPWVWWSQSRNTCPEFYSHIRWTPA